MAAIVSGSKTCSNSVSPIYTAAALTTLLAIAPENLTLEQLRQLGQAVERCAQGTETGNSGITVGQILV
jgi:hypothetical protein